MFFLQGCSCCEGHGDKQIKGVWICVLLQQTGKAPVQEHRLKVISIFCLLSNLTAILTNHSTYQGDRYSYV